MRTATKVVLVVIAILVGLVCLVAANWYGSTGSQEVAVAPLADLRLGSGLAGIEDAFAGWEKIVTKGFHTSNGDPNPSGIVEWFRSGEMLVDRHRVNVMVFGERVRAAEYFAFTTGTLWANRDTEGHVYGGSGGDRYCVSEVREVESRCVWFLPRGTGRYTSHLLFLKGRVVIEFYESAESPRADKDALVESLAARLRPFAVRGTAE